jgi:uncharacterized membrane protein HdeD (DUF308 family)
MTDQQLRVAAFKNWKSTMIAGGAIAIIAGLVLLIWPEQTLLVFAALLGIGLVLIGIARLGNAATDSETRGRVRVWRALLGLIYVIAGIVVLANLNATLGFLVWTVGVIWVVSGLLELFSALTPGRGYGAALGRPRGERGMTIVVGVLNLAFGLVLLIWPGPTVIILVWIAGFWLIALGLLQIIFAYIAGKVF